MKKLLLFIAMTIVSLSVWAQSSPFISYQAVVRDANNRLVTDEPITVTIQVLNAGNDVLYTEVDDVNSNANGLISLTIGDNNPTEFAAINWNGAKFKTTVHVTSSGYEVVSTTPVTAAPLALYSSDVNPSGSTVTAVYNKMQADSLALAQRITADSIALHKATKDSATVIRAALEDTASAIRNSIGDGMLTITYGTETPVTFTANQKTSSSITIPAPISANDAEITITRNGSSITNGTFTVNQSANQTIDIVVPTTVADLTDAGEFLKIDGLCDSIEHNCTNVALRNADNTFAGNNTFSGTNTVPPGFIVSGDNATNSTNCNNVVVNACDLWSVFDSLNRKIDNISKNYDQQIDSLNDVISELTFKCGVSKVKDIDGNSYNTMVIAGKCWLRENLRTTHFPNGEEIILGGILDAEGYNSLEFAKYDIIPRRHAPGGDEANVATYGYLYNWTAAMNGASSSDANPSGVQGICPKHWHLPSDAEWTQFTDSISANPEYVCTGPSLSENTWIAKALASTTGWILQPGSPNSCTTTIDMEHNNKTGFTVLPAGLFENETSEDGLGNSSHFWSSTQTSEVPNAAWEYSMFSNGEVVSRANSFKRFGLSVRCVREVTEMTLPTYSALTYTGSAQNLVNAGFSEYGTFTYSTSQDGTYSTTIPQGTNVGNYTVWYKFTGDANHADIPATEIPGVSIAKAEGSVSYAVTMVDKETTDDTPFTNELTHFGDGTVAYARSSGDDICTVDENTGEVTLNGNAGECVITATVDPGANYNYATTTASYNLMVLAPKKSVILGEFTASSAGEKVFFSRGNLQYTKSTETWSFMTQQFSTVETAEQNVGTDYADQDVVSLFGWGTSGYLFEPSAQCYQPWNTSTNGNHYWVAGYDLNNLYDKLGADWGYNAISNGGNTVNSGWRTPTKDEWTYIFNTRTTTTTNLPGENSGTARYTMATIGDTYKGVILFPDNYAHPNGAEFTAGTYNAVSNYTTSVSIHSWRLMEVAGCVFLPAAGTRNGDQLTSNSFSNSGNYWSSSRLLGTSNDNVNKAYGLIFQSAPFTPTIETDNVCNRSAGNSVRLIMNPVTTKPASGVKATKATLNGTAKSGDFAAGPQGFEWKVNGGSYDNHQVEASGENMTYTLTGLTPETTYTFRAFITTASGTTVYGTEIEFTTPAEAVPPIGAIQNGQFTVNSSGEQVYFSKGNLQYIGSASTPYWKFADHQYDRLGINANPNKAQNSNSQNVDRDLFGWGTSGYNHNNNNCYQPYSTVNDNTKYYAYTKDNYNLFDSTGKADWGYNAISNGGNIENMGWRTLTQDEWNYILFSREGSTIGTTNDARFAKAKVNGINGIIIFPDGYTHPSNIPTPTNINVNVNGSLQWNNCIAYSVEQWNVMEANGCVFLPTTGYRSGTTISTTNDPITTQGYYWSSSYFNKNYVYRLFFSNSKVIIDYDPANRRLGYSVRLVKDVSN